MDSRITDATPIALLPTGPGAGGGGGQPAYNPPAATPQGVISMRGAGGGGIPGQQTYQPLDVHPNPYLSGGGGGHGGGHASPQQPPQRLPGHHIPSNTEAMARDPTVVANYIPGVSSPEDYVRESERAQKQKYQKYKRDLRAREQSDMFLDRSQKMLLTMILFYMFQLPILNLFLVKYVSQVLPVADSTSGEVSLLGNILKTAAFGALLFGIDLLAGWCP